MLEPSKPPEWEFISFFVFFKMLEPSKPPEVKDDVWKMHHHTETVPNKRKNTLALEMN
jgi:hypothetical protein